jgi:hypothetical protein
MIEVARKRVGDDRVRVQRMQDITAEAEYDIVSALSWTIHYCVSRGELTDILGRFRTSLKPHGLTLVQVANDAHMNGGVNVELAVTPNGAKSTRLFVHRFRPLHDLEYCVVADYVYINEGLSELFFESHELRFASAPFMKRAMTDSGLTVIGDTDAQSIAPFICARVAYGPPAAVTNQT